MSTTLCSGLLKNIVSHYESFDTPVFACLLDASKAFDMVDHTFLFQNLLDSNTPVIIVCFLMYWYSAWSCTVSWNGTYSDSFSLQWNQVGWGSIPCAFYAVQWFTFE